MTAVPGVTLMSNNDRKRPKLLRTAENFEFCVSAARPAPVNSPGTVRRNRVASVRTRCGPERSDGFGFV